MRPHAILERTIYSIRSIIVWPRAANHKLKPMLTQCHSPKMPAGSQTVFVANSFILARSVSAWTGGGQEERGHCDQCVASGANAREYLAPENSI